MKDRKIKNLARIKKHWENPDTVSLKDKNLQELERSYILEILRRLGKIDFLADIGCGDASDTIYWRDYAKKVNAYDYSRRMLEKINKAHRNRLKVFHFDILKDELGQEFDVVITKRCLINLGSFINQKKAILKIHASIRKGGYYIMLESCKEGLKKMSFMRRKVGLRPINEPFHNVYFQLNSLTKFIKNYFHIEEIKYFSTYYFLTRVYSQLLDKDRFLEFDKVAKKFQMSLDVLGSTIIGPQFLMVLKKK